MNSPEHIHKLSSIEIYAANVQIAMGEQDYSEITKENQTFTKINNTIYKLYS